MGGTDERTPLRLAPKLTSAIWGGGALVRRYRKPGDPAARLGESWECWDENAVAAGPEAGLTVAQLRERRGTALTGPIEPHRRFPVLTKIIDAAAALSVQVHPDDAYARRVEGEPFGKAECWYVLDAAPDAELVLGWTRDTSRGEVEQRVADGTLAAILRRVPVGPGDAFYLPAGTLHAIGAGIQLFETQQASDLTYRLFDWNRVGPDGRPRPLHVAKAADVLEYRATSPGAVRQLRFRRNGVQRTLCVADPRFALERVELAGSALALETGGRPLAVTAGDAGLVLRAGEDCPLGPWETALVPAAAATVELRAEGDAVAFVAYAEPDRERLRAAARAAGDEAAAFFAQFPA